MGTIDNFQIWAKKFTAIYDSHIENLFDSISKNLDLYEIKNKFADQYQNRITFSYLLDVDLKLSTISKYDDMQLCYWLAPENTNREFLAICGQRDFQSANYYGSNYNRGDGYGYCYGSNRGLGGISDTYYGYSHKIGDGTGFDDSYGYGEKDGTGDGSGEGYGDHFCAFSIDDTGEDGFGDGDYGCSFGMGDGSGHGSSEDQEDGYGEASHDGSGYSGS